MLRSWIPVALPLSVGVGVPVAGLAADADPFDPSGSLAHATGGLLVEAPTLTARGISAGLLANIAEDLAVTAFADGTEVPLLGTTFATTVYGAYTVDDLVRVEAFLPGYGYVDAPGAGFSGPAFGDVRVQALFPIVGEDPSFGFALMPRIGLPTGTGAAYLRRGASLGLNAIAGGEVEAARVGWAANLAVNLSGSDPIGDVVIGSDVSLLAGSWIHLDEAFRVGVEAQGLLGLARGTDARRQGLATAHVFAQIASPEGVTMTVGAGSGLGVGGPEYRMFAAVTVAPLFPDADGDGFVDDADNCPAAAEDLDGFEDHDGCPDGDNDGDRILDLADGCPDEAEDVDDWMDEDGCPDPDNDGDGVLDAADACPTAAGPAGFDGCPDGDGDGLADHVDACPQERGPEATGGCPDRDGDGVPDLRDACPDDPIPDDAVAEVSDGCPARAYVAAGQIRITERVNFDSGRATIRQDSLALLDEIAEVFLANPHIRSVEVGGHTDDRGSAARNLELSQARAEAVVAYLVGKGVDAAVLVARGYGQERPIDTNRTVAGRANNRRVEFVILDQGAPEEAAAPAAGEREDGASEDAAGPGEAAPDEAPASGPWTTEEDASDTAETSGETAPEAPLPAGPAEVSGDGPAAPVGNPWGAPPEEVPGTDEGPVEEAPADEAEEAPAEEETPSGPPAPRSGNPWGPR